MSAIERLSEMLDRQTVSEESVESGVIGQRVSAKGSRQGTQSATVLQRASPLTEFSQNFPSAVWAEFRETRRFSISVYGDFKQPIAILGIYLVLRLVLVIFIHN